MPSRRPRAMKHPGGGARAQYTKEYKRWLDNEYNKRTIIQRIQEARSKIQTLSNALTQAETRLISNSISPKELRAYLREFSSRLTKLEKTTPTPPPIKSWKSMRSIEMHAYRKPLKSFDKWDDRMISFLHDANTLEKMLRKLAPKGSVELVKRRTDDVCKLAQGPKRRFIVLVRN